MIDKNKWELPNFVKKSFNEMEGLFTQYELGLFEDEKYFPKYSFDLPIWHNVNLHMYPKIFDNSNGDNSAYDVFFDGLFKLPDGVKQREEIDFSNRVVFNDHMPDVSKNLTEVASNRFWVHQSFLNSLIQVTHEYFFPVRIMLEDEDLLNYFKTEFPGIYNASVEDKPG